MELNKKYRIFGHVYCNNDISDRDMEDFFVNLEELMNKYEIYKVDGVLNPYNVGISINNIKTKK
jgi:hypothetical protein